MQPQSHSTFENSIQPFLTLGVTKLEAFLEEVTTLYVKAHSVAAHSDVKRVNEIYMNAVKIGAGTVSLPESLVASLLNEREHLVEYVADRESRAKHADSQNAFVSSESRDEDFPTTGGGQLREPSPEAITALFNSLVSEIRSARKAATEEQVSSRASAQTDQPNAKTYSLGGLPKDILDIIARGGINPGDVTGFKANNDGTAHIVFLR